MSARSQWRPNLESAWHRRIVASRLSVWSAGMGATVTFLRSTGASWSEVHIWIKARLAEVAWDPDDLTYLESLVPTSATLARWYG